MSNSSDSRILRVQENLDQSQDPFAVCIPAADHLAALHTSSMLTESFYHMRRQPSPQITPGQIIKLLNDAQVSFVLMGAHGIGDWNRDPRATRDVDLLIATRHHKRAVQVLSEAFPLLLVQEHPVVTRFVDQTDGSVLIELMKPVEPLYKALFKNSLLVENSYRIPDLEMALTSKYAAMISPNRASHKKHIDAGDFIQIVRYNHVELDLKTLQALGNVLFNGGGKDLLKLVDDVLAGRQIQV